MMLADESDVSKRQEDGFGFWACIFPIVLCGWFSFVQFVFLIFLIISKLGLWLLADLAPWQAVIALSSLATGLSSPHGQGEGRQLITRKERQQSNKIESVSAVSRCLGSFLDSDMEFTLSSQIQIFLCLIATVLLMGSMDAFPCPLKWYWSLHIFLRSRLIPSFVPIVVGVMCLSVRSHTFQLLLAEGVQAREVTVSLRFLSTHHTWRVTVVQWFATGRGMTVPVIPVIPVILPLAGDEAVHLEPAAPKLGKA